MKCPEAFIISSLAVFGFVAVLYIVGSELASLNRKEVVTAAPPSIGVVRPESPTPNSFAGEDGGQFLVGKLRGALAKIHELTDENTRFRADLKKLTDELVVQVDRKGDLELALVERDEELSKTRRDLGFWKAQSMAAEADYTVYLKRLGRPDAENRRIIYRMIHEHVHEPWMKFTPAEILRMEDETVTLYQSFKGAMDRWYEEQKKAHLREEADVEGARVAMFSAMKMLDDALAEIFGERLPEVAKNLRARGE